MLGTGLLLCIFLIWLSAHLSRQWALQDISQRSAVTLNLVVENLRGELGKYLFQPHLLALNPILKTALNGQATAAEIESLNRELERINNASGALDTYLMNRNGLTIAASNWSSPRAFIGKNFGYRPYFKTAMQGQLGRYFALGTASGERGYYFAYPVRAANSILGVIVVKMQVGNIESTWHAVDYHIAVVDFDNVIFLSSNPNWRFKTLGQISERIRQRLKLSRKYDQHSLQPLAVRNQSARAEWGQLMTIDMHSGGSVQSEKAAQFLVQELEMPDAGWRVLLFARTNTVSEQVFIASGITVSVLLSLILLLVVVLQRRHRFREQARLQEQATEELEARVTERTEELVKANATLKAEIQERLRTQEELHRAQDGLIQASKLSALGQMSAGLSHELNQPLAAIRAYANNARAFMERDQFATVDQNLRSISELTQRMARIIKILRTYARDEKVDIRPVSVIQAINESVSLLNQRLRQDNVQLQYDPGNAEYWALGGDVRLQQIMVNLISNALDAMHCVEPKLLQIDVSCAGSSVLVSVADSGPGIPTNQLDKVFDPFFSTKDVGQGMGLGLSITYGIVKQFGGTITVRNRSTGGARFILELVAAQATP